jgi:2-keto-4-pentenoate hydratase/2-oxohepta-3-ene-1,7-dioic acid hydratase in catechol pathway
MRIARFVDNGTESRGNERWGFVDGDILSPAPKGQPLMEVLEFDESQLVEAARHAEPAISLSGLKLLAPVPAPPQFMGIGMNYRDHAEETGQALPSSPVMFPILNNAISNPGDPIEIPPFTDSVDWEAELGIVIGLGGRDIPREHALKHIAGYLIINDVSARDVQMGEGQWSRAKSFDTFKPMGPWIATTHELGDAADLSLKLWVNDELKQSSSTSQLVFDVSDLVNLMSRALTLRPGMVISTGTPGGIGFTRKPAEFLKPGDVVTIEIEGIGRLSNPVVNSRTSAESMAATPVGH